jgi:hypothetical protein
MRSINLETCTERERERERERENRNMSTIARLGARQRTERLGREKLNFSLEVKFLCSGRICPASLNSSMSIYTMCTLLKNAELKSKCVLESSKRSNTNWWSLDWAKIQKIQQKKEARLIALPCFSCLLRSLALERSTLDLEY